jgi:hypothetical protein
MFDVTSRYYYISAAELTSAAGEVISYKRRRFLPQGATLPLLVQVTVAAGDRLDLIAARTIGAAEQSWRIADANDAMNPTELTAEAGTVLRVPIPQAG